MRDKSLTYCSEPGDETRYLWPCQPKNGGLFKEDSYFQSAMGKHWMWPLGSSDKSNLVQLSWWVVGNLLPLALSYPLTALVGHQLCKSCCGDEGSAGGRAGLLRRELVPEQLERVSSNSHPLPLSFRCSVWDNLGETSLCLCQEGSRAPLLLSPPSTPKLGGAV